MSDELGIQALAIAGWKVVEARHLTGAENQGRRNVYVDVVDSQEQDLRNTELLLLYGWDGMQPEETPTPVKLDKPLGEPAGNIALFIGMRAWVEIQGCGLPSERVTGLRTDLPADDTGNEFGEHSFYVKFKLDEAKSG